MTPMLDGETQPLWPKNSSEVLIADADAPSLTLLLPEGASCGASVIVCPGGGYGALAPHEAEPVGRWLNSLGITAWILRYRLHPPYRHPAMLHDAHRAVRLVRAACGELHLDAERVGILGFSAGGHLAATAATHFTGGNDMAEDSIEHYSTRPSLAILIYPVVTFKSPFGHEGSGNNLLGPNATDDQIHLMSNHEQVTADTPPMFMVHTADDPVCVENSLLMSMALSANKVPFEVHVYEAGGHGYGLGQDSPFASPWTEQCAHWLRTRGFLSPIAD